MECSTLRSKSTIVKLLKLRAGELETILSRLHSVVHIPEDKGSDIRILHASFTEFLLDNTRSRVYYTPKLSKTEYCDLLGVVLLCALSAYTACYLPYFMTKQSFSAAHKVCWKDTRGETDLCFFALVHWVDYCIEAGSPSADLLAALDDFDPYPVLSMLIILRFNLWGWEKQWWKSMEWAKSLGRGAPQKFISRLESFFSGFHVGFTSKSPSWTTSDLGVVLSGPVLIGIPPSKTFNQLILPLSMETNFLPKHWLVAHVGFQSTSSGIKLLVTCIQDRNGAILDEDMSLKSLRVGLTFLTLTESDSEDEDGWDTAPEELPPTG